MGEVQNLNLLHKGRRHHKHEMAKDPSLPALIAGSGRVPIDSRLKVEFLAVDGSIFTYKVWFENVVRFTRVPTLSPAAAKAAAAKAMATQDPPSPVELAKHHVYALLELAGGLENRIARAAEAAPSPSNVINIANIAAE